MEKVITLKTLTKEIKYGNRPGITEIQVKNGRRIQAKIYPPNHYRKGDEFQLSESGIARYFATLDAALESVRVGMEDRLNAFALPGQSFKVILEKK